MFNIKQYIRSLRVQSEEAVQSLRVQSEEAVQSLRVRSEGAVQSLRVRSEGAVQSFGYYYTMYVEPIIQPFLNYISFNKIKDVKPLNGIKIVVIDKIEVYDNINSFRVIETSFNSEYKHFTDWLNYSFKLNDTKPTSKSKLDFDNIEFIIIDYTYNNNTYKINLKDDFIIPLQVNISNSNLRRNVLEADIKGDEGLLDHEMDITQRLRKYLGPNHDFCLKFPNVSDSLNNMFPELYLADWENLHILDSFGKNHIIKLKFKQDITIKWDPNLPYN